MKKKGLLSGLVATLGLAGIIALAPKDQFNERYSLIDYGEMGKIITERSPISIDKKGINYNDFPARIYFDFNNDNITDRVITGGEEMNLVGMPSIRNSSLDFAQGDVSLADLNRPISGEISREFLEGDKLFRKGERFVKDRTPDHIGKDYKLWGKKSDWDYESELIGLEKLD